MQTTIMELLTAARRLPLFTSEGPDYIDAMRDLLDSTSVAIRAEVQVSVARAIERRVRPMAENYASPTDRACAAQILSLCQDLIKRRRWAMEIDA